MWAVLLPPTLPGAQTPAHTRQVQLGGSILGPSYSQRLLQSTNRVDPSLPGPLCALILPMPSGLLGFGRGTRPCFCKENLSPFSLSSTLLPVTQMGFLAPRVIPLGNLHADTEMHTQAPTHMLRHDTMHTHTVHNTSMHVHTHKAHTHVHVNMPTRTHVVQGCLLPRSWQLSRLVGICSQRLAKTKPCPAVGCDEGLWQMNTPPSVSGMCMGSSPGTPHALFSCRGLTLHLTVVQPSSRPGVGTLWTERDSRTQDKAEGHGVRWPLGRGAPDHHAEGQ